MKRYVASCSFGKDSMATILVAVENGEPLDEVVYCEVMFDKGISGEVPEHKRFIYDTAIPFVEKVGVPVRIIRAEKTFVDQFQHRIGGNGLWAGKIWAWPLCGRCYVQRDLKVRPMDTWKRQNWDSDEIVQYVGISSDEDARIARMDSYKYQTVSLLEKYGITQMGAMNLCRSRGLLSPIYEFAPRNGCFFCPNAREPELRHLYDYHPDLWERLLDLQALPDKATELFTRTKRFCDIDEEFRIDDAQCSLFGERTPIPFDSEKIFDFRRK